MVDKKRVKYLIISLILFIFLVLINIYHFKNVEFVRPNIKNEEEIIITEPEYMNNLFDSNTNIKLEYDLSEEILESDNIVLRNKKMIKSLKDKNVVKYFSLSLYDEDNTKKRIKNSLIKVTLYLDENLKQYDYLDVVRISSKIEITNDSFDVTRTSDSIIFYITMSSKYGIVGYNKK